MTDVLSGGISRHSNALLKYCATLPSRTIEDLVEELGRNVSPDSLHLDPAALTITHLPTHPHNFPG